MTYTDDTEEEKPKREPAKLPEGFKDEAEFLEHIRKLVSLDMGADKSNRDAGLEDSKFLVGDQWPTDVKAKREAAKKPVLQENYLPAFIGQVAGNRRLNETVIKIVPDHGGTKAVATVREGLIRSIQKNSVAEIAYNKAGLNQVTCGIGNFQVVLEYASDDVFEQDIHIRQLVNPFAAVWDRMSVEPTGRDAKHVTVIDTMAKKDFEKQYPDAVASDLTTDTALMAELTTSGWITADTVRVASHWCMRSHKRTLALMKTGAVADVTDLDPLVYRPLVVQRQDGSLVIRDADRRYAQMYLVTGMAVLAGPYDLPISRVPVFRVPGWEVNVGEERHRWGIVRFLKDSQRLHNYWKSILAEKYTQSPKATWVARHGAVAGREKEWRDSAKSDDPLLIFNDDAAEAPQRVDPVQIEIALVQEGNTAVQAMRDISNIHEASLGQQSNEVSGKAIIARQRVGELGTVVYMDNQNLAIEECGRVINQLIDYVYDGPRIIKILGPDDKASLQIINDAGNPASIDITVGKYSVSVTTGPSYVTKRVEAAESMLNFINAVPQAAERIGDLIADAQDWPQSEEIGRRLKAGLPPGMVSPDDMTPEMKQAQEQQSQHDSRLLELADGKAQAELDKSVAEVAEVEARTELYRAQADRARAEPRIKAASEHTKAVSTQLNDNLAVIDAAHPQETSNVGDKK